MKYFRFKSLLQKNKWITPAYVGVDDKGILIYISDKAPGEGIAIEAVDGFALPGFMNAHSHAFQFAMAGLAERATPEKDDFWTWREAMYQCAMAVDPEQAEAIATMLYVEMLRVGYTHVAEFHYLHHDQTGTPYAHLAEMGERMVRAASAAGIEITLIPVFYQKGGFGIDPQPRQARFISKNVSEYFKLLEASAKVVARYPCANLGFSVHSLRAVDLGDIITTFSDGPKDIPFHLHVAEQKKEISDCLEFCKKRPVEWLLDNLPVDGRFNLVHATHLDASEVKRLAASGATVVLCPSTEGNLGDGIFQMKEYCDRGGRWAIGTDSHIGLNPLEEFRMIDYRQRVVTHQRNIFRTDSAQYMVEESVERGRSALGLSSVNHFVKGTSFNAAVYRTDSPLLENTSYNNILSTLVFAPGTSKLFGTIVRGDWKIKEGQHLYYQDIKMKFARAIKSIGNR